MRTWSVKVKRDKEVLARCNCTDMESAMEYVRLVEAQKDDTIDIIIETRRPKEAK